jgi:hypothetical protein
MKSRSSSTKLPESALVGASPCAPAAALTREGQTYRRTGMAGCGGK